MSFRQRLVLALTLVVALTIVVCGFFIHAAPEQDTMDSFNIDMSIKQIAPHLGVTGKSLAKELHLPLQVSKSKPLRQLQVTDDELAHVIEHLRSHVDAVPKYYVYLALVLVGVVYLTRLGRPAGTDIKQRKYGYPRFPYIMTLIVSVLVAGFYFGKSPNPMEGAVKLFKSMAGLYPDPGSKVMAFLFFIVLAVVGNKVICGWACPFGALQELVYSLPFLRKTKKHKLPFALTNTIRVMLFILVLLFLFGFVGSRKGLVLYHFVNPFNLFDFHFESISILITVIVVMLGSLFVYRPFCRIICPFGLISWLFETISINRVWIDRDRCTECGGCIKACPLNAAKGRVAGRRLPEDCFSCGRCLNVCPVDAVRYGSVLKKRF